MCLSAATGLTFSHHCPHIYGGPGKLLVGSHLLPKTLLPCSRDQHPDVLCSLHICSDICGSCHTGLPSSPGSQRLPGVRLGMMILFSSVRGIIIIKCAFGKKFQAFLTPDTARPPCSWTSTHFVLLLVSLSKVSVRGGPEHGKGLRCLVFNKKQKNI